MAVMIKPAQVKLNNKVAALSVKMLCECFELSNAKKDCSALAMRGSIMDELERRDAIAFEAWMDSDDVALVDMPSHFFSNK